MAIAANIKRLLDKHRVSYRVFSHRRATTLEEAADLACFAKSKVLRTEILTDETGTVLAVVPLDRKIDFVRLKEQLNRNFRVLPDFKVNRIFMDCEPGAIPPFGEPYGLPVLFDTSIEKFDFIYFQAGSHTSMLQLSVDDFRYLNSGSQRLSFAGSKRSCSKESLKSANNLQDEQLLSASSFPSLPNVARKVLQLTMKGPCSVDELVELVLKDDVIHSQILSYAKLPFLTGGEKVTTLQDAIQHVLGFERVSHIALGVAAGRAFNVAKDSNVDLRDFWRHAFYCATLVEHIAQHVADSDVLDPSLSYLVGLLHNFGFLVFSQLFTPEFKLLSKWLKLQPKVPITILEKRLLGMGKALHILRSGHAQLGAWLLRHWEFPEQTWVVAKEHHNQNYCGIYANYVNIIKLTNSILRNFGIGDGMPGEISDQKLESLHLNLTKKDLEKIVASVMSGAEGLDNIVTTLAY